ncbi:MAG: hypothetical protein LBP87_08275 [Planctomycetaceae bacterium]|nr:hypothetical protein [Planctomycetaceae bacterium]
MKRQILLSVLAAIAIFAVTTTVEAGMFGRLHVLRGCDPCEPVACEPCESVTEPPVCEPCEPICEPCADPCGHVPFRPFGGFFLNLKAKLAAHACGPECAPECQPCEPICEPCEPICDPCADPCGHAPFLPFGGFFLGLKAKLAAHHSCNPCEEVSCQPCEPVIEPCQPCK